MAPPPLLVHFVKGNKTGATPNTYDAKIAFCTDAELAKTQAEDLEDGVFAISRVSHLKEIVNRLTNILPKHQILIHKGKQLNNDAAKVAESPFQWRNNDKVMVLEHGNKEPETLQAEQVNNVRVPSPDPKQLIQEETIPADVDPIMFKLNCIEKNTINVLAKDISTFAMDLEELQGTSMQPAQSDLNKIDKRRRLLIETCMKTLEQLDGIQLRIDAKLHPNETEDIETPEQTDPQFEERRTKRKKLVKDIQADLDRLDTCASQIHELLTKIASEQTKPDSNEQTT